MKVKMLEYFQGVEVAGVLSPGETHDLTDDLALWLVANKKAKPVGAEAKEAVKEAEEAEAPAVEPEHVAEKAEPEVPVMHSRPASAPHEGYVARRKGAKR